MMKQILIILMTVCLCLSLAGCFHSPEVDTIMASMPEDTSAPVPTILSESMPACTQPSETATSPSPAIMPEPEASAFVPVLSYLPGAYTDLKYASADNFTGQQIYEFQEVYLRYGTVKKLVRVQEELESMGLALKIWDGFRPVHAQYRLWEVCPDPVYVANPETGFSAHSRGNTVDLTIVDAQGRELEMPTSFDDFSVLADRDYSDCAEAAAENAMLLQKLMEKHGFVGYFGEWWHFTDENSYPVEKEFQPVLPARWYAHCEEYISLRTDPDTSAEVILRIPVNGEFQLLAWHGDFAMVSYSGNRGYVLKAYILPVDENW